MPFKRTPQEFTAKIGEVVIGTGEKAITLGGENVHSLYSFDAAIINRPKVGIEIVDTGYNKELPELSKYYEGAESILEQAKRASELPGADFLCLTLESSDPNGADKPIEESVSLCKEIADAVDLPLVVSGTGHAEKDAKLLEKVAEALSGKNVLLMSAREENYKSIAVSAGMAYDQKLSAESSVDINLAKQLNVVISQMGVKSEAVVMQVGSAAVGYGFEYVASTMERIKSAALGQNDAMLQMPIITPISSEAWSVKEAIASEADFPEWGSMEERGIDMEVATAAACLASGSNAVILRHPQSVATISKFVAELM